MDIQSFGFFLVKATALLGTGLAVASALRRAPAGTRHVVWLVTMAGVLALPALIGLSPMRLEVLPGLPARALTPAVARSAAVVPSRATAIALPMRPESLVAPAGVASPGASERFAPRPTLAQILFVVWITGGLALLGRLAVGLFAVRRIVGAGHPLNGPAWESILCEAADRLGLAELPRLVSSDRVDMPFACGLWRGTIVLPASADDWSEERRRLVLFHELAHMRRRDLPGHMLGRMACAAYWFHPLIWIALRRLRAESERACDDLVLASGTRPSDYAGHLLEILTSARRGGAPSAAVAMARRTEFEGRMLAILDPAAPRGVLGRFRSVTLMGGLAVLFLCVAALAPTRPVPASTARASQANAPGIQPSSPANEQAAPRTEPRRRPAERAAEAEGDRDEADEEEESRPTDEQTALLVRVLRTDTDADVRRSAAWALASGGDGKAVEALVAALKTDADDGVREMAAWALAEARGESASAALASALQGDRSEKVRAIAAWALGQQRQSDTTALVAAAADRAMKVREAAIWGLGNQHLAAAPTPLIAGLRDAEAPVRVVSAWALSQIADPAAAPALRAAFKDEKDDKVREAIFRALMLVGDRSPEVIEQVLQSTDADLRAHAVQMMSRHRGPWPWPWPRPQPRPYP